MRIEKGSITGLSYKGDFELPGGAVKEKDLRKVLTPGVLLEEAIRETKEELGIVVSSDMPVFMLYRTVFENLKTGKIDWAFMTPVLPRYWDETAEVKRKIIDLDSADLDVLGRLNLIVSGKKRMYRMGQACLCLSRYATDPGWRDNVRMLRAADFLTEVKPDWRETELLLNPQQDLFQIRYELGLEEDLYER